MAATGCSTLGNLNKCRSTDPDTRIAGCTAVIQASEGWKVNLYQIYNNRGNAYYSKRDYDHAIQDFNEAVRLSPNDANTYYTRGNAHGGRGIAYDNKYDYEHAIQDYNEAIQDYTDAIRLNQSYAFAYYGRGIAYDSRGIEHDNSDDYNRAIQDYNEAILLSPNNAGAYKYRGVAYNHKSDYDRAIQDFSEAIRLNPKDSVAYLGRGIAHIYKGDYDRAIQDFNELILLNPKDSVAYGARGDTYLLQSNLAAAISDFENAISAAPSSRMAVSTALMLHVAMKRQGRDDARQLAQVAATADLSKWPGPVLKLDMGKMTAGEVMAAAVNPADDRQKWHVCQANYFIGEDALFHNQQAMALAHLKAARDGCPHWDAHYAAALVELKRLGAPAVPAK
jgi:tetratricopeptide (TPR) repeat protein